MAADVDLAGDGDRRGIRLETIAAAGRRRARHRRRDAADQGSALDGEVAAADRERIGTQENPRQPRTALAGEHDVTGHGRPHSAGKVDAAGAGG